MLNTESNLNQEEDFVENEDNNFEDETTVDVDLEKLKKENENLKKQLSQAEYTIEKSKKNNEKYKSTLSQVGDELKKSNELNEEILRTLKQTNNSSQNITSNSFDDKKSTVDLTGGIISKEKYDLVQKQTGFTEEEMKTYLKIQKNRV